jgi:hypothetical protein
MSSYFKLGGFHSRGGVPQENSEYGVNITICGPCKLCGKRLQKSNKFYDQVSPTEKVNERKILEHCRKKAIEWGRHYLALHEKCSEKIVKCYVVSRPASAQYYCLNEQEVWTVYENDLIKNGIPVPPIKWTDMQMLLLESTPGDVLEFHFFNVEIKEMKAKEYFSLPEFIGW